MLSTSDIGTSLPGAYRNILGGPVEPYYLLHENNAYRPYANVGEVLSYIALSERHYGLTVLVLDVSSGMMQEYQWLGRLDDGGIQAKGGINFIRFDNAQGPEGVALATGAYYYADGVLAQWIGQSGALALDFDPFGDPQHWNLIAGYDGRAVASTLNNHEQRLSKLEVGGKCILVATNGQRRYYNSFPDAAFAMQTGDTLEVYGTQDYTTLPYIANYADGTIFLGPGALLKCATFYCNSVNLVFKGSGEIQAVDFSIEPLCTNLYAQGIGVKGTIGPYGYAINTAKASHVFYDCTLDGGDAPVYNALYKSPSGATTYAGAEFLYCRIATTATSVFKFTDTQTGNTADAEAEAENALRLIGNTIAAPAGAMVVDDTAGSFTFEQGLNTYVTVSPPTKPSASSVVSAPGGAAPVSNVLQIRSDNVNRVLTLRLNEPVALLAVTAIASNNASGATFQVNTYQAGAWVAGTERITLADATADMPPAGSPVYADGVELLVKTVAITAADPSFIFLEFSYGS